MTSRPHRHARAGVEREPAAWGPLLLVGNSEVFEEEADVDPGDKAFPPPEIWAQIFEYLPYSSVRSCAAASTSMLRDALPLATDLHVDDSSALRADKIFERLRDVRRLNILCLFRREAQGRLIWDRAAINRSVLFLSRLPQLKRVNFLGWDRGNYRPACILADVDPWRGFEHYPFNGHFQYCSPLFKAFCQHFDFGALSRNLRIMGLRCRQIELSRTTPCKHCESVCRSFPLESVLDVDMCLQHDQVRDVMNSRPGGREYCGSFERILKLLGKGTPEWSEESEGYNTIAYEIDLKREIEASIAESDLDMTRLNPIDVRASILERFLPEKFFLHMNEFDYLKGHLRLPLEDDLMDPRAIRIENLPRWARAIMNESSSLLADMSTKRIRQLLELNEHNPPIEQVIGSGVLPRIVELLSDPLGFEEDLQFEAAWIITNLTARESCHTQAVVAAGCVAPLIGMLSSSSRDNRSQAVWALGNIAGDGPRFRDLVLAGGALPPLLEHMHSLGVSACNSRGGCYSKNLRDATWTLTNLHRAQPPPDFDLVSSSLPMLATLIEHPAVDAVIDACWALCFLTERPTLERESFVEHLGDPGFRRIVMCIADSRPEVQSPALKTIVHISRGSESQAQKIIDCGGLPCLLSLMSNSEERIQVQACMVASNLCSHGEVYIEAVRNAGIFPPMIEMLMEGDLGDLEVQKEVLSMVLRASSCGTLEQIEHLVRYGCIPGMCKALTGEEECSRLALQGLEEILKRACTKPEFQGHVSNLVKEFELNQIHELSQCNDDCKKQISNKILMLCNLKSND